MASALHRHPFNLVGNESSLAMRPAELANSREFNAKFSLFLRVFGENDVSAIDPACKKKGAVGGQIAKRFAYLIGPAYIYPL